MGTLILNGKEVEFEPGETLLQLAWRLGIDIPVFCYHPQLPVIAACRMCLVEVEHRGRTSLMPACGTAAQEGMKVSTDNKRVREARKDQLQFLLLHHPLECPVCDAGGDCDLQNITFRHGPTQPEFEFPKHEKERRSAGPFLELYPNRCIICYRCVSFYRQIEGGEDWGYEERGTEILVGPYRDTILQSEFSGNMIEVCPLGAITGRDYRFKIRPWEYTVRPSVSPHDSLGANLKVFLRLGTRYGRGHMVTGGYRGEDHQIFRCNIRYNPEINDPWIDDRSRFVHEFINAEDRVLYPRIFLDGTLQDTDWDTALHALKERLQAIVETYGPEAVGGIAGGIGTNEAALLFEHWLRHVIGTPHLDSRPPNGQMDRDPLVLGLGFSGSTAHQVDIDTADLVLAFNVQIKNAFPVLGPRLLRQKRYGLSFHLTPYADPEDRKYFRTHILYHPCHEEAVTLALALFIAQELGYSLDGASQIDPHQLMAQCRVDTQQLQTLARELLYAGQTLILFDDSQNPRVIQNLVLISVLTKAKVLVLRTAPNGQGFVDQGVHPCLTPGQVLTSFPGMNTDAMLDAAEKGRLKALILWNVDPLKEFPDRKQVEAALQNLDLLVVFEMFHTETASMAHFLFPVATPFEEAGTYTTTDGILQPVEALLHPPGLAKDAREAFLAVLRTYGIEIPDFTQWFQAQNPLYRSVYPPKETREVDRYPTYIPSVATLADKYTYPHVPYRPQLKLQKPSVPAISEEERHPAQWVLRRHLYWTRYGLRSPIVQELLPQHTLVFHPETAQAVGIPEGEGVVEAEGHEFPYRTDPDVPKGLVLLLWPPMKTEANRLYRGEPGVDVQWLTKILEGNP